MSISVYLQYLKAGGGCVSLFFFFLTCIAYQFCFSFSHYWLSTWKRAEQIRFTDSNNTQSYNSTKNNKAKGLDDALKEMDTYTGIYGFAILVLCGFILSLIRSIHFFSIFLKASIRLHDKMFQAVVRSPLLFFNRNPIGIPTFKFYRVILLKNLKY